MKRTYALFLLPVLSALWGPALPASAGDSVPFKATASLTTPNAAAEWENCINGPGPCCFHNVGTGVATHLDLFTVTELHCSPALGLGVGTMTLTAANGDQLFLEEQGVIVPTGTGFDTLETDQFTITGGTGRFGGAPGGGTIIELFTSSPVHPYDFNGTIDFKKK